ncbi:MAG: hypothetical protein IKY41_01270, partial [Clostridia bacterium]|nr:hypothetical protein [Clostridia bacterium]
FVELLGMMEKDDYRAAQAEKIKKYEAMNIFLGGQLIFIDVTMGFSTPVVTKILQQIIARGAPDKIVAGYNRTKHDRILAQKAAASGKEDDGNID